MLQFRWFQVESPLPATPGWFKDPDSKNGKDRRMRTCVNFFVGKRSEEGSTEEAMHKREHSAFSPRFGVDPVVSWEDLNPPFCPHGLFTLI